MKAAVDLDPLHELTGGDLALERRLFASFLHSSSDCLNGMKDSWKGGMELVWQQRAHALKGMCLNLGAERLGALCKLAQSKSGDEPLAKLEMLHAIEDEFERVKQYLGKLQ